MMLLIKKKDMLCYEVNAVSPKNSHVEALPPDHVMIFGGRALGMQLGLDEVMRVRPLPHGINVLLKRGREFRALSPPRRNIARRQLSASWKEHLHRTQPC